MLLCSFLRYSHVHVCLECGSYLQLFNKISCYILVMFFLNICFPGPFNIKLQPTNAFVLGTRAVY